MRPTWIAPTLLAALASLGPAPTALAAQAVVASAFVYDTAPFPSAHASTIAETPSGLVAAWFGGAHERAPDVGIWVARRLGSAWTPPVEVATGVRPDGTRLPCWNPVLFRMPDGALALFYKVGPSPAEWWGMLRTSRDDGRTWSDATRLPDGVLGPVKNKPVRLADGTLVSPSSTETTDRPSVWRAHVERSTDGGRTWSPLALTALPNPDAGTDAVTLRDGRHLLVYNHTPSGRSPLNVAVSRDGATWDAALVLEREPGEYSYPSVIQTSDGLVHVTYTWKRTRVRHVVIDPARLRPVPMPDGRWPAEVR